MSYRLDTIAIHAGQPNDPLTGAVVTAIYQTTTYAQNELGGQPEYCYTRTGNPSRTALEQCLAALEGARFGLAFASGMAAVNALLCTLKSGDHVVASQDLYGGCYRIFTKIFSRFGVTFSLVDVTDPANVRCAITPFTKLLWLETPSNPLLRLTDIAACAAIAKHHGVRVVVDNTFATPVFQRPLELGADIVLHSTTKYIGGHCDVLGGALITDDPAIQEELKFVQNACGASPAPQDCFLLLRGIKTLSLRVKKHEENSRRIAALARELELWPLAESLGGVKSLWCHPATMTHASVDPQERARIGIGDGLIRLSIGLEDAEDLIDDLVGAIDATTKAPVTIAAAKAEEVRS